MTKRRLESIEAASQPVRWHSSSAENLAFEIEAIIIDVCNDSPPAIADIMAEGVPAPNKRCHQGFDETYYEHAPMQTINPTAGHLKTATVLIQAPQKQFSHTCI